MKLTDSDLLGAISAAESEAIGGNKGEIASDRADALDRYLGKDYDGDLSPQPGRSSIVSRDVADVVEGVVANVLKPFVAGDTIVSFTPRGPEDQAAAEQESDYINHLVTERNNGFLVLNTAVKDALLLRNGYVRVSWETRDDVLSEDYQGLSDEELNALVQDDEVEVVAHSEYPDPAAVMGMAQLPMLHDVRLRRKQPLEFAKIDPVPPDEIKVSARCSTPSVQDADFVQHAVRMSISEVRQMDYDIPDDISDDDNAETIEGFARERFAEVDSQDDDQTADPARRMVLFKESWIRIDFDGDGIAELRRVCSIGANLLANEEADHIPLAVFTPVVMGHQHLGISVYDLIKDIARIKTALLRNYLDAGQQAIRPRTAADVDAVNMDDLLLNRIGGVVRTKGPPQNSVMPLITPDVGPVALQGLEYMDSIRENRTGYTKAAEGMRSGSLATDTLGELQQQVNQSQMRLEMIARTIAETGVRDLFRLVHTATLKHSTRAEKVKLRNQWVLVDPRQWVKRYDMSVSVGLGTSTVQQQMQNLMLLAQVQEKVLALGLATPENVYNLAKKLAVAAGFKNPDEFFTKPQGPPPQQKDPIVQAEEIKSQTTLQAKQMDGQIKGQEAMQKASLEERKMQQEAMLERERMAMEFEFKRWEAQLKHETEIRSASLQAEVKDRDGERMAQVQSHKAERDADTQKETARITARAAGVDLDGTDKVEQVVGPIVQELRGLVQEMSKALTAEREVVRDPKSGRAVGTRVRMN
jgi:hypothetical protein